ncbi:NAD(P)-dependent dehydrogenase (short-subunit alcohol dehydrogenase family) [Rhodoblastus acidophilus]|uniref:SDR family oxidoreductase n=1 Tax=Rhodoblastus acidophilus TaxID=1074 RepID=UPI00222551D0|nr:SDR family oxidoreductase [Rhodoblastus acidophilus]MCW2316065.1 NAD(P)-dependent dehydrogenase (short-subunit alcohol dehydrogenase family) [Rhodoblastus acidophilus]
MADDTTGQSRRTILGGMTFGGMTGSLFAAGAAQAAPGTQDQVPPNPVTEYPRPPFARQQQPWPGLASLMNPPPDHGETSYRGSGRLLGRKALITGGDSGMGRAAAIAYAREGADVAINYLPAEESDAQEVAALIRAAGRKAVALPGDLRSEEFCTKLVTDAAANLDGLDIVVSNAARQVWQPSIEKISTQQFDDTFKTNVYAMFWILRAAAPLLKPGSAIIATASVNAYEPSRGLLDYAATKGAIMIFVKALAKQMAERGVRVNAVAPGPIWTPLQPSGGQPPEALSEFGADTPMKRPGQPAELAPLYVLLASHEATFTTGQVFGAAGGRGGP